MAHFVAGSVKKYIGVDYSRNMIQAAQKRFQNVPNVEFIRNDGCTLKEIGDGSVDLVFCELAFQHFENTAVAESYVKEAHRVLRDGGMFLAQVPKDTYSISEVHEMFAEYSEVEDLWRNIESVYYLVRAVK